jgi:ACAD9/ACADV, C-terminal domain
MRLFIAREAVDPHLKISAPVLDRRLSLPLRGAAGLRAAKFYTRWYASTFLPRASATRFDRPLAQHARWCEATARQLARGLFHQMIAYGPRLEKRQLLLARFVDAGAELFAMSATLARVQAMIGRADPEAASAVDLADYFCRSSQDRIAERFRAVRSNSDDSGYRLAQKLLAGLPETLSEGILRKSTATGWRDPSLDALS